MKLRIYVHIFGHSDLSDKQATKLMEIQNDYEMTCDSVESYEPNYVSWWYSPKSKNYLQAMHNAYLFAFNTEILLPKLTVIFEVLRG